MWLGLVVVGLILFAAGIFWGFSAKQASGGGLFSVHVLVYVRNDHGGAINCHCLCDGLFDLLHVVGRCDVGHTR